MTAEKRSTSEHRSARRVGELALVLIGDMVPIPSGFEHVHSHGIADTTAIRQAAIDDLRALMAERDRLRAALDDCAHRARRIMGSIGYQDDDNSAWIGPDMHAIMDHANREGVKP